MLDDPDVVRDERGRLELDVVDDQVKVLGLELDSWDGDLLDQTDKPGNEDVDNVSIETLSLSLQAAESGFTGTSKTLCEVLERLDQLSSRLVVGESVDKLLQLVLEFGRVLLPLRILLDKRLGVIVERRGLSVGRPGRSVTRRIEHPLEVCLQVGEV